MIEHILDPNSPVSLMPSWHAPGVLPFRRRWSPAIKRHFRLSQEPEPELVEALVGRTAAPRSAAPSRVHFEQGRFRET